MTDYNFAKNYENIKDWEFKSQSVSDTVAGNYLDQFLNLIKSYPNLILLIKTKKILFVPTLFVLAGVVIVEIVALVPTINIKRLESTHYEYEDKVNALNKINLDRENKKKQGLVEIRFFLIRGGGCRTHFQQVRSDSD